MKKHLYRFFTLVAVVTVLTSIWYVKINPHSYQECAKAAQISALNDLALDESIGPISETRRAQHNQTLIDNQIKCSDLDAQWGMTDIALLGYIAGLLGLFFLGITVYETQSAASSAARTLMLTEKALAQSKIATKEAKRGADAAWEAANSARDIGQKEIRAYMIVQDVTVNVDAYGNSIYATLKIENVGQTPAPKCHFLCTIGVCPIPVPKDALNIETVPKEGEFSNTPVGSGGNNAMTFITPRLDLNQSQSKAVDEGNAAVFVYGRVNYEDIFGAAHHVDFRYGWGAHYGKVGIGNMVACESGNSMT